MMDCKFGLIYAGKGRARGPTTPKAIVTVGIAGQHLEALVDLGCGQTLILRGLVPETRRTLRQVSLRCTHRDLNFYPTLLVPLTIRLVTRVLPVGLAPRLLYPIILGQD